MSAKKKKSGKKLPKQVPELKRSNSEELSAVFTAEFSKLQLEDGMPDYVVGLFDEFIENRKPGTKTEWQTLLEDIFQEADIKDDIKEETYENLLDQLESKKLIKIEKEKKKKKRNEKLK